MASLLDTLALIEERLHPRASIAAHHAAGIIAINKGAGLLTHPNFGPDPIATAKKSGNSELAMRRGLAPAPEAKPRGNDGPAWIHAPYSMAEEAFALGEGKVFLCNRLDSATSGIFILCTDPKLAVILKEQWSKQAVTKIYLAIQRGGPSRPFEKWSDTLQRRGPAKEKGVRMQARQGASKAGGRLAKTIVRRVHQSGSSPKLSLVVMEPLTGRTHQLRAQSKLHHCPILGDAKYGDFSFNKAVVERTKEAKGRLFLHSHVTRLMCEFGGESIDFVAEAPIPQSFAAVLKGEFAQSTAKTVKAILAGK